MTDTPQAAQLPSGVLVVGTLLALSEREGTRTTVGHEGEKFVTITACILTGHSTTYVNLGDAANARRLTGHAAPFDSDGQAPERVIIPCYATPFSRRLGGLGIDYKANRPGDGQS